MPLSQGFMNPQVLQEIGTGPSDLLQGLVTSRCQAADSYLVPTLTNKLFAQSDEPVGLDLMSLNIQVLLLFILVMFCIWVLAS